MAFLLPFIAGLGGGAVVGIVCEVIRSGEDNSSSESSPAYRCTLRRKKTLSKGQVAYEEESHYFNTSEDLISFARKRKSKFGCSRTF